MIKAIKAIQRVIGKDKLASLSSKAETRIVKKRPIADATLKRIMNLIKVNVKITRSFLLDNSGLSEGITQECVRVLYEGMLIGKEKNYNLPGNPIVYVWIG